MRLRSDFRAAVSIKNRLHRESGEEVAEPISPQYRRWHSSSRDSRWILGHVQKLVELMRGQFHPFFVVCCSRFRLQLIAIYCNRREWCRQRHFTRHFFSCTAHVFHDVWYTTTLAQVSARARHVIAMVIHVVRVSVSWLSVPLHVLFRVSPVPCSSHSISTWTLTWTSFPCGRHQGK